MKTRNKICLKFSVLTLVLAAGISGIVYGAYAGINQTINITNNVTFTSNDVVASIYMKKGFNDVSTNIINPSTDEASALVSFADNDVSTTKTASIGAIDLSNFEKISDYYLMTFYIYNLGNKNIYVNVPAVETTKNEAESNLSVELTKSSEVKEIEPTNVGDNYSHYYSFSLKWKISSLTEDADNSLKNFSVSLSGYPLAA